MRTLFPVGLILLTAAAARADVAILMLESTGKGMARYTAAGHTAVYLSNLCMESAVRLRLCGPGENGSVISAYTDFGETKRFEWNVAPLNVFLYGVDDEKAIPH